jgi:hypothetical protein
MSNFDKAISSFVLRKCEQLNREPETMLWLGDVISEFICSEEYAKADEFNTNAAHALLLNHSKSEAEHE